MADKTTCYECEVSRYCYLHTRMAHVISESSLFLNIDSDERPGSFTDIHTAVARACLRFTPRTEKKA